MKLQFQIEHVDALALKNHLERSTDSVGDAFQRQALERILNTFTDTLITDTQIDNKVTNLLSSVTSIPEYLIKNEHKLGFHLGMGASRIRALAGPLTMIAQQFKSTATITLKDAEKLKTVQECIDLIKSKTT